MDQDTKKQIKKKSMKVVSGKGKYQKPEKR